MITIKIGIESKKDLYKRRGRAVDGFCRKKSESSYEIWIRDDLSTLEKVGVLFHEFTHIICGIMLNMPSRKNVREEDFAGGIELYGKALFSWYLNKREAE